MIRQIVHSIIVGLFLSCLSFSASAQHNRKDIVYLKNSSVVKGIILEMIPNGTIKIETTEGSLFVFKMEEVEKMEKEIVSGRGHSRNHKGDSTRNAQIIAKPKGYFIIG